MIGASKILTVSYGTFSCTLEGFDEPFNTMKAIAEYFRDLAADDRYFGAEPPTPDAAMLHRIAEREIQRRVEAKIQDNGVILRASDFAPAVAQPAPAMPPVAAPAPAAPAPGLLAEESVAAKLQRIRSAVSRAAASVAVPVVEDAVFVEDEHAELSIPAFDVPAPTDDVAFSHFDDTDAPDVEPVASAPVEAVAPVWEDRAAVEDSQPESEPHTSSEQDLPEAVEDTSTQSDDALIANLSFEDAAEVEEPVAIEDEAEAMIADEPADQISEEDLADLNALDGQSTSAAEPEDEAQPEYVWSFDTPVSEAPPEDEDETAAEPIAAEFDAVPDYVEDPEIEIEAEAAQVEDWQPESEPDEPAATPIAEKLRRARARVIKVRRPDAEAQPEVEVPAPAASLSPEEEAELQRELEAVERDAEDDTGRQTEREGRTILESSTTGDEAVNRLLRQTNTEMEGPENKRRMSTLAHLKAAVAATVADLRSPSGATENGEASRLDRYRADLARVVRPRRPGAAPDASRPAPLVLVSEQRIDAPKAPTSEGGGAPRILPRRVTSGNLALHPEADDTEQQPDAENIFASSKSFAEFADRLGATELPDLLEAAAAYTSCIEGRPHFSRPHLMRYISEMKEDGEYAREDGLRSFGQLLRQGKIEKVRRGQFAITDNSYYLAEARRMVR